MSDIEQSNQVESTTTAEETIPATTPSSIAQDVAEVYESAKEVVTEAVQSAVTAIQDAHLLEKANDALNRAGAALEESGIPAQVDHIQEVVQEKIEESHIKENIQHAVEVVQQKLEEAHIQENVAHAVEVVKEKVEEAVETIKEKVSEATSSTPSATTPATSSTPSATTPASVYEREPEEEKETRISEEEKAKNELKQTRGRSNSKLGNMIGMFEKKVEDLNSTLTPGVNSLAAKPPTPRSGATTPRKLGSTSPRPSVPPLKEASSSNDSTPAKESPRAEIARESPRTDIAKESPRLARTNSGGKLGNMIGMFEKKVEDLNSTLTPGVNDLAKPPKPTATTHARKNSFGKKQVEEEKKPEEKKYKFDVKVSTITSDKKNTELLKSAVKEEAWEGRRKSNADEDEESRPRRDSLGGLKEKFENQEEPVK